GPQSGWLVADLSDDEDRPVATPQDAPVVGIAVGSATFLTTSTGQHYGTFHSILAERHQRDRQKRRRKAKLRDCLKKKGVRCLPSTRKKQLAQNVRQESIAPSMTCTATTRTRQLRSRF